jgi:glycosyltransferase involved in cell wall biosynthesis
MVSVLMITYKHQNFIEDAVLSILNQKCSYDFELIIADDNSPDGTQAIIEKIINEHKYGHKIKYTRHNENKGMMGNFIWSIKQVKHKYIALCEGDDYWTSQNKLQMQIDFMESNLQFSMCYHSVDIIMANETDYYSYPAPKSDVLYLSDIIKTHYIPTCSLLFRSEYIIGNLPSWFVKSISGDIPLEILLASKGMTKFIDKKMACYRRNEGGISQSKVQNLRIRSKYIYMYYKLIGEIGLFRSKQLVFKIIRLILSIVKSYLFQLFKFSREN